jgi:hypothetical protein
VISLSNEEYLAVMNSNKKMSPSKTSLFFSRNKYNFARLLSSNYMTIDEDTATLSTKMI